MESIRDISLEIIKNLPESSTMEDIMYKLNMTAQTIDGLNDKNNGNVLDTQQLLNEIKKWETQK